MLLKRKLFVQSPSPVASSSLCFPKHRAPLENTKDDGKEEICTLECREIFEDWSTDSLQRTHQERCNSTVFALPPLMYPILRRNDIIGRCPPLSLPLAAGKSSASASPVTYPSMSVLDMLRFFNRD